MPENLPRKALIAISSYHGVIYPDGTKTGLFFTEALHPFEVFTQAGFDVDLATETGTFGLDDLSLTDQFLAGDDKAVFDNPEHPFNVKLNSELRKASDLQKEEYGLFFGSAGHAALYDYPTAEGLQAVGEDVWTRGGIVAAVCHGPVILPKMIDSKTGKSIIAGKTVTGFTVEGEVVLNVLEKLRSDKAIPVVEAVSDVDADYSSPMHPFDDYSITAGRVVTGANPASARSAAERAAKAFDSLQPA
ncbi:molecular chaperone Hsp31 [Nocardia jiangxiensis]|uniref:Molecular chaperone Hsp31 n=1 Tax=Nocardia jiangxiensis TaxID=282685 RepID=A0ABW6SDE9_9NOCA|nr:molecular chaperone Hsp31 [Nocardia jiangxiensis]